MSQLRFFPPPPPPRWEGAGYHSEFESSDKFLETLPITKQHIELVSEGNNNNNSTTIPPPPPRIHKYDIPPPPPPIPMKTQTHNNDHNDHNDNLPPPQSPADNTPESLPSHSSFNITMNTITKAKQGEMDDGIASNMDMDVDKIDLNDINDNEYEYNEYEDNNEDEITKYNKRINIIFGDRLFRSLYMNITLFLFCIFSFPLWFGDVSASLKNKHITNAYILAAFSIFVTFLACGFAVIIAIFDIFRMQLPFKKTVKNVTMTMYFVGGFFYFVAACQYAHYYTGLNLSGFGAIWFVEMFYISMVTMISGIDFWKPFLNRMDHRIYTFFILYIFCSIILMFSYLICSDNYKLNANSESGFIAIGVSYLFGFVVCVMFLLLCIAANILTEEFVIKPKLDSMKPKLDVILSVLLFVFMLFTVISYWATQRTSDVEKVYYVGFGIFMLAIGVLMTFDMKFSLYIAQCVEEDDDE